MDSIKTGADLLHLLAPPIELMETLGKSNMPPAVKEWWERWRDIRWQDQPSVVDGTSQEVYQEALLIVEEANKKAKVY